MQSEVVFGDEEESSNDTVENSTVVPGAPKGMLAWLIRNKFAKDLKQAEQQLLAVTVIAVILGIGIFIVGGITQSHHLSAVQQQSIYEMKIQSENNLHQ